MRNDHPAAEAGIHQYEKESGLKVDFKMPPTGKVEEQNRFLEDLTSQGYRLVDVSGYEQSGQPGYAAIWVLSDGRAWQARHGLTVSDFQEQFNLVKGSIPARMDVPGDKFDDCGKKSMADLQVALKNNAMLGSFAHGHAVPESVKGAMIDVVTNYFNKGGSPAQATKQLVAAVENAR